MKVLGLKKIRVIIALFIFSVVLFSFIDVYELIPEAVVSKFLFLQFLPSLLKFAQFFTFTSIGFLVVILLTVIIGRFYCSAICPLGIIQDVFTFIAKRRSSQKRYFKFTDAFSKIRYGILIVVILSLLFGLSFLIVLLDPYSSAGRIFTYLFKPFVIFVNNIMASIMQRQDIYTLKIIEVTNHAWFAIIYSILFVVGLAYFSYIRGRIFCNVVCPVGTLLGLISKKAIVKVRIDADSCTKCGRCSGNCKSECIDIKNQNIDYSRCIVCYDCLTVCNDNAIDFSTGIHNGKEKIQNNERKIDRRNALSILMALTASTTVLTQNKALKSSFDKNESYSLSLKIIPVSPPGSKGIDRFNSICTACGLCISACPTSVLQPAIKEYGLSGFMQPYMDYVHSGFCNYDCSRCGNICPTGAIVSLSIEEKQLTQLGKAVFVQNNCVVFRDETACGACSEHCPTKAVDMVKYKNGLVIPSVNQNLCIGCGACEYACPVQYPYKAIYVEGNKVHQKATKPFEEKSDYHKLEEDFPF